MEGDPEREIGQRAVGNRAERPGSRRRWAGLGAAVGAESSFGVGGADGILVMWRGRSRRSGVLAAVVALAIVPLPAGPASAVVVDDPDPGRGAVLPVRAEVPRTGCRVFPADNVWNTRIDALPVHAMSETWLAASHAGATDLHPDFGPPSYGLPYTTVGRGHPKVRIEFLYQDESDRGPYPFDANTPIEGGSDRHALIVERGTCRLYELFAADWNGGNPEAGSGAIWDLDRNRLRPDTWTSADAAGLPILAGLVRWDEVRAGEIAHAIRFTVSCTTDSYLWPARHQAGVDDPDCPPMGARFRLRADFDPSGFGAKARVILRAMQRYGMIVADNGSDWYFQGTRDRHWRNALLDELKTIPASAFEAVDQSGCMVDEDSGRADCP
jgi:hypothetical protein